MDSRWLPPMEGHPLFVLFYVILVKADGSLDESSRRQIAGSRLLLKPLVVSPDGTPGNFSYGPKKS